MRQLFVCSAVTFIILMVSCKKPKQVQCQTATHFYLSFNSKAGLDSIGKTVVDTTLNDTLVVVERYEKATSFTVLVATDTSAITPRRSPTTVRLSDLFADVYNANYRITFLPSRDQYLMNDLIVHEKTQDEGSVPAVCYRDLSFSLNNGIHLHDGVSDTANVNVRY